MRKFTINRPTWLRGETAEKSYLFRPEDEKMCCLGQIALQCGATRAECSGVRAIETLADTVLEKMDLPPVLVPPLPGESNEFTTSMMALNDVVYLDEPMREQKLIELCIQHNIELVFIN